jgi:AcrR family transcriptional regulator
MRAAARPVRGTPAATRARLVAAAARELERRGFHGTDSNRIARAAGYAPGTFYKHFADKTEVFLAVYDAWVKTEWAAIGREINRGAAHVVALVLAHHRRWRGLRASLRELVATDARVRAAYRAQRKGQLVTMAHLLNGGDRAKDAMLLWTLERACDAIADGEARALGLDEKAIVALSVDLVARALGRRRAGTPKAM